MKFEAFLFLASVILLSLDRALPFLINFLGKKTFSDIALRTSGVERSEETKKARERISKKVRVFRATGFFLALVILVCWFFININKEKNMSDELRIMQGQIEEITKRVDELEKKLAEKDKEIKSLQDSVDQINVMLKH